MNDFQKAFLNAVGKMNITSCGTGESLKEKPFIELHDAAAGFIKE